MTQTQDLTTDESRILSEIPSGTTVTEAQIASDFPELPVDLVHGALESLGQKGYVVRSDPKAPRYPMEADEKLRRVAYNWAYSRLQ